jgi:ABC-2 type transport system ATP-binding protein
MRQSETGSEPAVHVSEIVKSYGRGEDSVSAVDDISFEIKQGSVVGILGPNGAGKTTLIKSILGLILPDEGDVKLFGKNVRDLGSERYQYVSAMLEGARNIYWRMSLRENVRYFSGLQGLHPDSVQKENTELISRFGMGDKSSEPVRNLSRGQKQRASLACVLAQQTPITFLDEPTLGLDVQAAEILQTELRDLTEKDDRTVILNSHNMDVVERLCDRVIVLKNGSVLTDGSVASLIDAFDTQTYEIRLSESVSEEVKENIRSAATVSWHGDDKRFSATVDSTDEMYSLMERMDKHSIEVSSMETADPDLEEAFLRVTDTADEVSHV